MAAKYPLSPAMWRFVEHSRAFASDSPRLDAQRAAYARMCQAFAPPRPAGLRVLDSCLPAAPPVRACHRPDRHRPAVGRRCSTCTVVAGCSAASIHTISSAPTWRRLPAGAGGGLPTGAGASVPGGIAGLPACLAGRWSLGELDEALDGRRLLVAGDSAGGNLAAALCLAPARWRRAVAGRADIALSLAVRCAIALADRLRRRAVARPRRCAGVPGRLPAAAALQRQPLALPLEAADFTGLPPAFVAVAEFDAARRRRAAAHYARRVARQGSIREAGWSAAACAATASTRWKPCTRPCGGPCRASWRRLRRAPGG